MPETHQTPDNLSLAFPGKLASIAALLPVILTSLCGESFPATPDEQGVLPVEAIEEYAVIDLDAFARPVFQDVSVHDPSVVRDGDTYYVFGSHLAAAKTRDWMAWEQVADRVTVANPLFQSVFVELADTFRWAQTNTLWAADVIQAADGTFRYYYNACRGDSPRSAMGLAVSESVEGPYRNDSLLLRSGMWGNLSEDGVRIYDAAFHPNVVDPDVFRDAHGKLWMIYGSYSGGIFILEMDEETGKPLPEKGYGQHLMGGNHQRIEGPCVLYSPHTGFYYLFVSYGGLAANGGYQVRVARSLEPDGPYLDFAGVDMREVRASTAFNDAAIAPFAAKIMGNHYWRGRLGSGYVSPGHNTAWYDEEEGRYLMIFHTRFPGRGELHQVRVHEFFFNEDGWPVVSPLRFAPRNLPATEDEGSEDLDSTPEQPESEEQLAPVADKPLPPGSDPAEDEEIMDGCVEEDGECDKPLLQEPTPAYRDPIPRSMIPGSYQMVQLGRDISAVVPFSIPLSLHEDGTVTGVWQGTWTFGSGASILLTDAQGRVSKGVASIQWSEWHDAFTVVFSAMSSDGLTLWGVRDRER